MDDPVSMLRMAERIVAVLLGGMAIYLGYRLFFHLPFTQDNSGELQFPGVKVVLSRVGPGVFFAVLGSVVLYYSLTNEVRIVSQTSINTEQYSDNKLEGGGNNSGGGTFIGLVPTGTTVTDSPASGATVTPRQRGKALTTMEMLNCAQRLLVRNSSDRDLQGNLLLAIRDAKRTLLISVWNADAWGSAKTFKDKGITGTASSELRAVFDATYGSCPQ